MQSVGNILRGKAGKRATLLKRLAPLTELYRIRRVWPRIVGQRLAAHSFAHSLQRGKLLVHVDGSAWVSEFGFQRENVIGDIYKATSIRLKKIEVRNLPLPILPDEPKTTQRKSNDQIKKLNTSNIEENMASLPQSLRETMARICENIKA